MEYAAEGIILASTPYEEAFILDVFTKEYGRITFVSKRQKKQKMVAASPLLAVELIVIPSEKRFWKCSDMQITTSFPKLRTTRARLLQAASIANLLTKILPTRAPHPECFDAFRAFLEYMPLYTYPETATCLFLLKFCHFEGLFPSHELSSHEMQLCAQLVAAPFDEEITVKIDGSLLGKLEKLAKGGT